MAISFGSIVGGINFGRGSFSGLSLSNVARVASVATTTAPTTSRLLSSGGLNSYMTLANQPSITLNRSAISEVNIPSTTPSFSFGQLSAAELARQNALNNIGPTRPPVSLTSITRRIEDIIPPINIPGISIPGINRPGVGAFGSIRSIAIGRRQDEVIPGIGVGGTRLPGLGFIATPVSPSSSKPAPLNLDGTSVLNGPNFNPGGIMNQVNTTLKESRLAYAAGLAGRAMGMVANMINGKDKFQRTYNWELLLPGIGILSPDVMGRYIQEVSFGEYSVDEIIRLRYGGETRGHAGTFSIPRLTVKFLKPVPDLVYTYLMLWKDLIVDSNGFFSAKSNYAMPGYLMLFDTTGKQSGSYKVVNMFPLKFPTHNLSYAESSIVSYTVEFNVDRLETLS